MLDFFGAVPPQTWVEVMTHDEYKKLDQELLDAPYPEEYAEDEPEYSCSGSNTDKRLAFDDGIVAARDILEAHYNYQQQLINPAPKG